MKMILAIGSGSFIGGIARYVITQFIQTKTDSAFPFATLAVNVTGCLLIGIVFALGERASINPEWRLFLATGVLGGFTTYSAFSNETFGLLRNGLTSYAIAYVVGSVFIGLLATWGGYTLCKLG